MLPYLFRLAHQLSSCDSVVQVVRTREDRNGMLARAALFEGAVKCWRRGGDALLELTGGVRLPVLLSERAPS